MGAPLCVGLLIASWHNFGAQVREHLLLAGETQVRMRGDTALFLCSENFWLLSSTTLVREAGEVVPFRVTFVQIIVVPELCFPSSSSHSS